MGVMTTETRMATALLLEKDVARVCAWLLKTPTLEWEFHYHRHFDELHYHRLFYDRCITTDFFMTWLKKKDPDTWMRVSLPQTVWWASLLQTFVWKLHSSDSKHVYEFDYYRPRHLKESRITTDTLMPVSFITTDFRMVVAVGTDKSNDFDHFAK